jgi:hypothetical protein
VIDVVLTFDLGGQDADGYRRAREVLAGLGFSRVAKGLVLPNTTFIGKWWPNENVSEARNVIWHALSRAGVEPTHLLVAAYTECAWIGPPTAKPALKG